MRWNGCNETEHNRGCYEMPQDTEKACRIITAIAVIAKNDACYWRVAHHILTWQDGAVAISADALCMRLPPDLWPDRQDFETRNGCVKCYLLEFRKAFETMERPTDS